MKRLFLLFAAIMLSIGLPAQTQQGYVKTKGRLAKDGSIIPGQGLKGATVSIKGRTTVLVNADDGSFSFPVPETQFRVDSVKKKGYQLVDMDALSKAYKHSPNPIYFVMETPEQQLQDQLDAETKIRHNLQKLLLDKEEEIENLRKQNKISQEEYQQALQKLYSAQSTNEQLISNMAKRYSEIDYDQLDDFYRQVSFYIENGELVKADSLLKSRGDITQQVDDILQRGQTIMEQDEQLQKAKTVQQADIDEAALRCYSYYETFAAQYQNDTAVYFLKLRASLDTTNVEWSDDAGEYLCVYLGHYDQALTYEYRALRNVIEHNGETDIQVARLYNSIGKIYIELGQYTDALDCFDKALAISISSVGTSHTIITSSIYNNIGLVYTSIGDYSKALEYFNMSLIIKNEIFGESHPKLLHTYSNIGAVYYGMGWYKTALEYFIKALTLCEDLESPTAATLLTNVGRSYDEIGDFAKGLEYQEAALRLREKLLGLNHPDVADSYLDLGTHYKKQGDYAKALENTNNALQILTIVFNKNHPCFGVAYKNLGGVYLNTDQFDLALEYYNAALSINETLYGRENKHTAVSIADIGYYYLLLSAK